MKTQEKQDEFIRNLVRKQGTVKAPDNFTEKVMGRISAGRIIDDTPLLSRGTWIGIILGLAAVVTMIFMVDIPYIDQLFSASGIQKVSMNIFNEGFFSTMSSFFDRINISSITWMIIAAAVGLVVLDRILRKRFYETRMLFI